MHDTFDASRLQQQLHAQFRKQLTAGIPACSLFSLTLECPDLHLRNLPPLPAPYLYWARPDRDLQQLGLGEAWRTTASGPQRFDTLSNALRQLECNWQRGHPPGSPGPGPGVFCALAFAPDDSMTTCWEGLPNSILFVPRILLRSEAGQTSLTFTCTGKELQQAEAVLSDWSGLIKQLCQAVSASQKPTGEDSQQAVRVTPQTDTSWTEAVQRAIDSIKSGQLDKVVTARRVRLEASRSFEATKILSRLARLYPSCLLLAIKLGGNTVISATPERLATLRNRSIRCDALGGTTSRSQDSGRDRQLALRLLNSHKTQHEHALVVKSIQAALEPLCRQLALPDTPAVVKLRNLQHLWTGIKGTLRSGVSLLDAARRLHPTPAVAGTPTATACRWLQDHENLARGWYSGIVGWLQPNGDGELSVLLRCAVLQGRSAELFAGAGIVADSDPQAELQETEIKLRAMLEAMQEDAGRTATPLTSSQAGQQAGHS
ncbi:MAG: isochorismate synthase [Thiogranum sp.]